MTEPMKYGQTEFEVHLPPELIAAELEPNQVDLPQRTTAEHIRWALLEIRKLLQKELQKV